MNVQFEKLKNNLNTIFINHNSSQVGTIQIWFRAGSALETKNDLGIAHFLEHMFFKGTKKRPSGGIARAVESFGGEINAFTSFDYTCYYINFPLTHLKESVDILLDMVSKPQFAVKEIPSERMVVLEEYNKTIDSPAQFHFTKIQEQCFLSGYHHPILGSKKTISVFNKKQLETFRQKFYGTENSFLLLAGNFDDKQKEVIKKQINAFKFPKGVSSQIGEFSLKIKSSIDLHFKKVNHASLLFAIPAPHFDSEFAPHEDLALNLLTQGENAFLHEELVLKNTLATNVSGSTMFFKNGGIHLIKVFAPVENLEKIAKLIPELIKKYVARDIEREELERIQNQFLSSKIYEKESIESFAFSIGHSFAQTENLYSDDIYLQKIKGSSSIKVKQALNKIFSQTIHLSLQLPEECQKQKKEFQTMLTRLLSGVTLAKEKISTKLTLPKLSKSRFEEQTKVYEISPHLLFCHKLNKATPTFSMQAYFKGGQAHESAATAGNYSLLSRTITYGHQNCSYENLKRELEHFAISIDGFSGKNAFGLNLHSLQDNYEKALYHFTQTLIAPNFPEEFVNLEKELTLRSIHISEQDPIKQMMKKVNEIMFASHPYSLSQIGTKESVSAVNPQTVKKLLSDSVKKSPMVIVGVGSLDFDSYYSSLKTLDHELQLKTKIQTASQKKNLTPPNLSKVDQRIFELPFDREQIHLVICKRSYPSGHDHDLALSFLNAYLSGQGSPLFYKVRDELGLCYAVSCIQHSALEAGYFGIYIGTSPEKKDTALNAIFEILDDLANKGFTQKQFQTIKEMIKGHNILGLQTNDDFTGFYGVPLLHELGLDYGHLKQQKLNQMNLEKVNQFMKKFLTDDFHIVMTTKN